MSVRFIPKHPVSYRGEFYPAGKAFEIDAADSEEMARYGWVELQEDAREEEAREELQEAAGPRRRRRG